MKSGQRQGGAKMRMQYQAAGLMLQLGLSAVVLQNSWQLEHISSNFRNCKCVK